MALGATLLCTSSCRWIHETFYSVEACTEWYCDQIYDAYADGDFEKATEREQQMDEWVSGLDSGDQLKATAAAMKWLENNPLVNAAMDAYDEYDW